MGWLQGPFEYLLHYFAPDMDFALHDSPQGFREAGRER